MKNEDDDDGEDDCDIASVETEEERTQRLQYLANCDALSHRVRRLEDLQVELLKILLINDDNKQVSGRRSDELPIANILVFQVVYIYIH